MLLHVEGSPPSLRTIAVSTAEGPEIEDLYHAYGAVIRGRCRRLLGDDAAAEDATHEVFLRVQRHITRAPAPERDEILPWLSRIATNYCLNELRNRTLRARPVPSLDGAEGRHPEDSIAARDEARRLFAALPERLRHIAWLTYVDDLEQSETAKALGISRRTVVSRIRELRERVERMASGM